MRGFFVFRLPSLHPPLATNDAYASCVEPQTRLSGEEALQGANRTYPLIGVNSLSRLSSLPIVPFTGKLHRRLCNACGLHYQAMMRREREIEPVDVPKSIPIEFLRNPPSPPDKPTG